MLRLLDFIDKRDGVVLEGNAAAFGIAEKPILAETEFAGSFPRHKFGRWRQEGPVELLFPFQAVQKLRALGRFGLVGGREIRQVDHTLARCDFKAAGTTHHEVTGNAGGAHGLDQRHGIAGGEVHRADHGIVTFKQLRKPCPIENIALFCHHVRQAGDLFRAAGDRRHLVAPVGKLLQNTGSGIAGGSDERDFSHDFFLCRYRYWSK
ncbi:hypothetical protein D3C80_758250 [compost metagenome]